MVEIVKDNTDVNKVRRRLVDIKLAFKESMDREVSRIFEEIEDLDTEIKEGMSIVEDQDSAMSGIIGNATAKNFEQSELDIKVLNPPE